MAKSSTGLEENIAALLSYLVGWITGLIFFLIEKDSKFVKFHAMQSIIVFVVLMVVGWILAAIPFIGWVLSSLVWVLMVVLWIVLMVKAYQGVKFKLPVSGDLAEKWSS